MAGPVRTGLYRRPGAYFQGYGCGDEGLAGTSLTSEHSRAAVADQYNSTRDANGSTSAEAVNQACARSGLNTVCISF
jgi:hypothetical protein